MYYVYKYVTNYAMTQEEQHVCLPEVPSAKVVHFLPALSGTSSELVLNSHPKHPVVLDVLIPLKEKVSTPPLPTLNNTEQNTHAL